jgi:glycosyltransferase 2 family protein
MKKLTSIIKFVITAGLIYLILSRIDTNNIVATLLGIKPWYIILLLVISIVMVVISCLKWGLFLKTSAINVPLIRLVAYYFIGYFFNNLLPSNIGGDLFRSYLLGKNIDSQVKSFSSVFLERITGLVALLLVGIVALICNPVLMKETTILLPIGIMFVILTSVVVFFAFEGVKNFIFTIIGRLPYFGLLKKSFDKLYNSISFFKQHSRVLGYSMIYSFLFQTMTIVNALVCCWAIGVFPNVLDVAVTVPIIMLISVIPISIGALGLWEGAFAYFFVIIGVPPAAAVSVALILRLKTILLGLLGGILFLFQRATPRQISKESTR